MSSDQAITPPATPLQFDAADVAATTPAVSCVACKRAITGDYYQVNDVVTCDRCHAQIQAQLAGTGSRAGRALKATGLGLLGGLAGGAVWYAVLAWADLQVGFISILVGALVGRGVRRGSGGRGGWRYQTLAIAISYFVIGAVYMPFAIKGLNERATTAASADSTAKASAPSTAPAAAPAAPLAPASADSAVAPRDASPRAPMTAGGFLLGLGALALFALMLPVFVIQADVLTLFFIGIALWEAWRQNKRLAVAVRGPFRVGGAQPTAA